MNELEKEIKEKLKPKKGAIGGYSGINEIADLEYTKGLKDGCNFIREKNLPVLFAKWLDGDGWDLIDKFTNDGFLDYDKIYDYWENNVYGKEK